MFTKLVLLLWLIRVLRLRVKGEIDGVPYTGAVSPDRVICSYLAALEKTVVVTNSNATAPHAPSST